MIDHIKTITIAAFAAIGVAALVASGAQASTVEMTIDFDDTDLGAYELGTDHPSGNVSIVNGNCADPACLNLRAVRSGDGETVTLSLEDGGLFSVSEFWFQLLGQALDNTLLVTSSKTSDPHYEYAASDPLYDNNDGGHTISGLGSDFEDITYITFTNVNVGGLRVDDIKVSYEMAVIPLPAAGFLLLGGLGGLAMVRRRKRS